MKNRIFLLIFLLFFARIGIGAQEENPDAPIRVSLIHVNDVYQFMPVDGGKRGGFARLLTLKKQAFAENPNTIFTFGGDTLSPSVESLTFKGAQMVEAWNAIGLDFAVFGNHEFDLKKSQVLERIKESKFTWLGANVIDETTKTRFANTPEYSIREFEGVKIGIVGLLLPETKETSAMDSSLSVADYCKTADLIINRLRKVEKVDAVVGLTHLAMGQDKRLTGCADFDIILGGHEHTLLESSANGTPIFKMDADARNLGKFTLNFDRVTKKLQSIDWQIIPITEAIAEDPEFQPVIEKYREIIEKLAIKVGNTSVPLNAYSRANRTKETNLGDFIADSYRISTNSDIGFVNGGSIRADLLYPPGEITKRDVLSILPYNNPIVKLELTGKLLLAVLEHGVGLSGEDSQPGRFPQISGMTFIFDASRPPGSRVISVEIGGKPLVENRTYTLATSDFLAAKGGDGYTMLKDAKVLIPADASAKDSEVLEKMIRLAPNQTIAPVVDGRIKKID